MIKDLRRTRRSKIEGCPGDQGFRGPQSTRRSRIQTSLRDQGFREGPEIKDDLERPRKSRI